jgi:hypothetical protein
VRESRVSRSVWGRIKGAITRGRFSALFWLLVVTIALPVAVPGPMIQRGMAIILFIVMLSGLRAISNHRREMVIGVCLAVPAVILNATAAILGIKAAYLSSLVLYGLFFGYLAVLILLDTLRRTEIEAETIYAAVDVYLLLALFWTMGYYLLAVADPGSFHFPETDAIGQIQAERVAVRQEPGLATAEGVDWREAHEEAQGTLMYYSFVTLTTLGYGDIYPAGDAARILAMLEATLGQLYLVILVARLVGLYTAQESERRKQTPRT